MELSVSIDINAPKENVWAIISDIENSANVITAITSISVLNKGETGLVGFKWKETRLMFGKEAEETMWITESVENEYYKTRAESHGSIYITKLSLKESDNITTFDMSFEGQAVSFGAKLMYGVMGWMFVGSMKKALMQDLNDIKKAAEQ